MSADDVSALLRLIGLPLWAYGLIALLVWNKRTAPKKPTPTERGAYTWPKPNNGLASDRSLVQSLRHEDQQPKPPVRISVCLATGLLLTFVGLILSVMS